MSGSGECRLKGLCIKASPLGENDRLITILTDEQGIVRLAAPGSRRPKSSLAAATPLTYLSMQIFGKRNLKSVRQIKILKSYSGLGKNIECLAAAQAITELTFLLVGNNDKQQDYLSCVLAHLDRIYLYRESQEEDIKMLSMSIQSLIHLLAIGGINLPIHDVAYIGVRPIYRNNQIAIELTNYSVFYTQGITTIAENDLKKGRSQIVVENGQVLKISKDKDGFLNPKEVLTKEWHDWIDYWSIDFDFESKKEIIQYYDKDREAIKTEWTGSYIFENEWQSFRSKTNRSLEMVSDFYEISSGMRKIAIKVVDIFGNDTMKIIPINMSDKI